MTELVTVERPLPPSGGRRAGFEQIYTNIPATPVMPAVNLLRDVEIRESGGIVDNDVAVFPAYDDEATPYEIKIGDEVVFRFGRYRVLHVAALVLHGKDEYIISYLERLVA